MVKVAVIGTGYWGKNLVRNFHELGALGVICDADAARVGELAAQYPGVERATDTQTVFGRDDIAAVAIATPAETHYDLATTAMQAGHDVFVEKPLALRYEHGRNLVQTAKDRERILMVGHVLEYHPAVIELKKLVDGGELGDVQYIYSNRLSMGKIRREENILWSFAPHDIAVILRLLGQMPFEVVATGGAYVRPNIADVTVTNLLFDNGVRAHIFVSWLHPFKEQRLVVLGSKKMVVFNDVDPHHKLALFDQRVDWVNGEPLPHKDEGQPVAIATDEPLKNECRHFLDCVRTRRTPLTDGRSALAVLCVLRAAQQSLQTNGQPVQMNLRHDMVNL
jgi:UDP-2-acetamido-3-amino-2,3-dideoxy-glucuronate N-acetyltransferase